MTLDSLRLRTRLAVPRNGGTSRVQIGGNEWIVEAARGSTQVLWHAGRDARRYVLGVPDHGVLELALVPPMFTVHVQVRETMALVPGARVRGYVQIPLVPRLEWHGADAAPCTLLEFPPDSLATEWEGQAIVHTCVSPWFARFPMHGGEAVVTVPVRVRNDGREPCSPHHLPIALAARELYELRHRIVAAPRRLRWDGRSFAAAPQARSEVMP